MTTTTTTTDAEMPWRARAFAASRAAIVLGVCRGTRAGTRARYAATIDAAVLRVAEAVRATVRHGGDAEAIIVKASRAACAAAADAAAAGTAERLRDVAERAAADAADIWRGVIDDHADAATAAERAMARDCQHLAAFAMVGCCVAALRRQYRRAADAATA